MTEEDRRLSKQHYERGLEYTAKEEWIEAIKEFEKAVDRNEENDRAHYELGSAYSHLSGRTKEAIEHMREAIKINPANAMYRYTLGIVYLNNGDTQKAVQEWKESLSLDPNNPTIQAVLKKYQ